MILLDISRKMEEKLYLKSNGIDIEQMAEEALKNKMFDDEYEYLICKRYYMRGAIDMFNTIKENDSE